MATKKKIQLPEVNFSDYGDTRYLHLGTPWVQGSMNIEKPFDIDLEYVQRMMAWLLFVDIDQVNKLHAMQLGLRGVTHQVFVQTLAHENHGD